jgi:hypothetical protein
MTHHSDTQEENASPPKRPDKASVLKLVVDADAPAPPRARRVRVRGVSGKLSPSNVLNAIANWENRASPTEARYFFAADDLEDGIEGLRNGKKCFVRGSKGAGKSAVLQHIRATAEPGDIFIENRFSPKNLKDFCKQTSNESIKGAEVELLWTYFICAKTCLALATKKLGPLRRFDLGAKYGLSSRRSWGQRIWRALPRLRKVKIDPAHGGVEFETVDAPVDAKGNGLTLPAPRNASTGEFLWGVHSDLAIDDAIEAQKVAKTRVFILFDEIDQTFSQAGDQQTFDEYLITCRALIASVQALRNRFDREGVEIYPIVAIRSDIYSYIPFSDKGALNNRGIDLVYKDDDQLQPMLAHRIDVALGTKVELADPDFAKIWKKAVNDRDIDHPDSIYNYISRRTLNRPRDFVEYLKLAALEQRRIKPARKLISQKAVAIASGEFSTFFLQEFMDELSFRYPFADRLTDVFRRICPAPSHNRFTFEQFVMACQERGIDGDRGFFVDLAKYLFVISVFGVQMRRDGRFQKAEFRYRDEKLAFPAALDATDIYFCLHTGFLRALFGD